MKKYILFFSSLLILFLSSCGQNTDGNSLVEIEKEVGYTDISDSATGSISGRILLKGQPVSGASIYLGDVLNDKDGNPLATSVDRSVAPFSIIEEDGDFSISSIPAGKYGVMFSNTPEVYLLLYPNEEQAILLEIIAGKEYYLGELNYSDLPLK
jgi:hypothetical protein